MPAATIPFLLSVLPFTVPPPFHARLASRVGDYTLLMKDDWTIKDWLPGEKPFRMLGVHRMLLHASRLALVHPLSGEPLQVHAPLDAQFQRALALLSMSDAALP